jgi:L-cysteine S-thiosulfotransferase
VKPASTTHGALGCAAAGAYRQRRRHSVGAVPYRQALWLCLLHAATAIAADGFAAPTAAIAADEGLPAPKTDAAAHPARAIAFDPARGNCLACHAIADGRPAGNVGPRLEGIAARFASRAELQAFLHDPRMTRPQAMMPPYGRNGLLSARELALLTDWLWSL